MKSAKGPDGCEEAALSTLADASGGRVAEAPLPVEHAPRTLFRPEALRAKVEASRIAPPLEVVPPWARSITVLSVIFVLVAVGVAFGCKVEQTGQARGVLRVVGGSHTVVTAIAGTAVDVRVHAGDAVAAGDIILLLDSAPTRAIATEAEAAVVLAEKQLAAFKSRRTELHKERRRLLLERVQLLGIRERNQAANLARLRSKLASTERMERGGVASALDVNSVADEVSAAEREQTRLREEITALREQTATLDTDIDAEANRLELDLQRARDRREALAIARRDTTVRAPVAGRVDTLLVKSGEAVGVGATIARVIPTGTPLQIVAFLPERDRAFVKTGLRARVDLDQFPAGEFGYLAAHVQRVGADIASTAEIQEALGDRAGQSEALYRIELDIDAGASPQRLRELVRPGSVLTTRMTLRTRRVGAIVFEPLRRFLDGGT